MNYFTHAFCNPKSKLSIRWIFGLITLFLLNNYSFGQTYYDMSSGNYSESFTAWSGYSTNWNGNAILPTGSVPVATKTTAATTTLATIGTSTAIGYNTASSTKLAFLATGATDNTAAVACDLNLNFTGRNAGNLSFDYALIFNSAVAVGRASSLIVYYSINGTTWTTLTGPYTVYNTIGSSTADVNVSIALPAALNNEPTVKLRFYGYNGGTVIGSPTGSRPRISIDNVSVTSNSTGGPATTIALANGTVLSGNSSQNSTNNVLYRTDVTVANSSEAISSATFTTAGSYVASDLNNLKLWYSTASTFAVGTSTLLSTKTTGLGAGSQTFSGLTQSFSVGTAYLYVTADINCAATISNTINVAAIASTDFIFTITTPTGSSFTAGGDQTITAGVIVPNNPATFTAAGNGTTGQIGASWTVPSGCYDDFMIVASPIANTGGTPSGDGSSYSANLAYGSGTPYGNGFVMYKGAASPQSLTGFTSGTSYSIKIFTRKGTSWSAGTEVNFVTTFTNTPIAEVVVPQFMHSGGSNARVPSAYCVTLSGLTPNATYRYTSGMVLATDSATTGGAGNNIFTGSTQSANFVWGTPSLSTTFGTLTANSSGSYTGWFITEPTGNATYFTAGNQVFFRIRLNDGNNGTFVDRIATTTSSSTVITMSTTAGGNNATAIRSTSLANAKDFVCLYDNTAGTGRPLAATFIENDGNASVANFATFITSSVNGVAGAWGAVIPNALPNGLRRIETRSFTNGSVICSSTDSDGVWTTGSVNTVNPTGGSSSVLVIATADAGLDCSSVLLDHTGIAQTNSRIENLNSNDNIISNFRVNTSLFATTLNSISFVVGGTFTAGNVSNFKLYTSTSSSFPGGTALSSVNASALATGATITFTGLAQACAVGNRYFWITADFGLTGSGNTIDIPALGNADFTFASNATIDTNSITAGGTVTLGILEPSIALSSATIATGNINDGTVNNVIYRANVAVTVTSASLTSASFTTGGTYVPSDVTNFKLWYSTSSTFATGTSTLLVTKTTSLDAGLQAFSGFSQTIPTGTAYLYLTTDLPCATTIGNTISVNAIANTDITFASGTPTGSGSATGDQTISASTPLNATGVVATAVGLVGQVSVDFVLPTACFEEIMIVVAPASNTGTPTGDGSAYNSTLNYGTGTALGNGKVVYKGISSPQIITGLTTGVTYYFKIFTRNGSLWSSGTTEVTAIPTIAPALSEVYLPQYIASGSNRVPYAYRVTLFNLTPNATYRYYNSVVLTTDISTSTGAGNFILVNSSGTFTRSTSQTLSTAGSYGTFTTDATGSYSGWFITESTGNARFTAGNAVKMRIMLNDGNNGTAVVTRLTTTNTATVISFGTSGSNVGTGIRGTSYATAKNFVMLWGNAGGSGRPVAGTMVESDGTANTSGNSYASFYSTTVDGVAGSWGTIIPNTLTSGVRRIQQFGLSDGSGAVGSPASDSDGIWPSGVNTISPSTGTTALVISISDAPLSYVTNLRPMLCGKTLPALNTVIQSSPISLATQYRFEVTRLDDNSVRTATVPTYYFNPATQLTGGFVYGKSYSIKVQVLVGVWQAYGSACVVTTPNEPIPTVTKIRPLQCGKTLLSINDAVQASPVYSATQYEFEVTYGATSAVIPSTTYYFRLSSLPGGASYSTAYTIRVRAFATSWLSWGDACIVTTPAAPIARMSDSALTNIFEVKAFPNPFARHFSLDVQSSSDDLVQVKVYDMIGRALEVQNATVSELSTKEIGTNYPSGVYNVVVSQGDKLRSVRMIKR